MTLPMNEAQFIIGKFLAAWAYWTILLLLTLAVLVGLELVTWFGALLLAVGGYVVIEAALRRRLTIALLRVVLVLAIVTAVILVFDFRIELIMAAVAGLAIIVVAENVREVTGR